jgi:glucokinase
VSQPVSPTVGPTASQPVGRPASGTAVVAVDVGGTSMKGALVGRDGAVLATETRPTGADPETVIEEVQRFAVALADRVPELTGTPAAAAGIVVPGLVDEAAGVATYSANIGWRNVPFAARLTDRLDGLPVALGHDVRAGGLAEARLGAGQAVDDFLFLPVGTGIAGAIVLDGTPYAGDRGWSGELGHVPVWPGGEPCACGQRGCLETYASAAAIARRYRERGGARPNEELGAADASAGFDAAVVGARAEAGDPQAAAVWAEAIEALAIALAGFTLTLDPGRVLIGGGLAEAGDRLFVPLRQRLTRQLTFRDPPPVEPAALGPRAATLGAALLAWRLAGDPDPGGAW